MAEASVQFEGDLIEVEIDMITIPDRLRLVRPEWVEAIAVSIRESGLLSPIAVARDAGSNGFILVDGEHRLEAFRRLGLDQIPAIVREASEAERQRHEIYANLIRNELNALDRATFVERLVSIFEAENPQFGHGGDRKSLKKQRKNQVANIATWSVFAKEAARRTGLGERSLRSCRDLIRSLDPEARDALRLTDLADNQAHLIALAALPAEEQRAIAGRIASGEARNLKEARIKLGLDTLVEESQQDKLFRSFIALWGRADGKTRRRIAAHVRLTGPKEREP